MGGNSESNSKQATGFKKLETFLPLLFGCFMAIGMFMGFSLAKRSGNAGIANNNADKKMSKIQFLVNTKLVSTHANQQENENSIIPFLDYIDPFSMLVSTKEYSQSADAQLLKQIGVYCQNGDTLVIKKIVPGNLGNHHLLLGDTIFSAIQYSKMSKTDLQTTKAVSIAHHMVLELQCKRKDSTFVQNITLWSKKSLSGIWGAYLGGRIGYIQIPYFGKDGYIRFMETMRLLNSDNLDSLVVDLRNNTGGILQQATYIADEFLKDGQTIVQIVSKEKTENIIASKPGIFETKSLTILVNGSTASEAEAFAVAMQDHSRGTIVGEKTAGKALVQSTFAIENDDSLHISTQLYLSPLGRNFQILTLPSTLPWAKRNITDTIFVKSKSGKKLPQLVGIHPDVPLISKN